MGIIYTDKLIHWNYFLSLERDFEIVTRYVEPCAENNDTYSTELARLLMAAAQETDVVLKALCEKFNGHGNTRSIEPYHACISSHIPDFIHVEVEISQHGMRSKPWEDWASNTPPIWWTANNKVKHHRITDFNQASLKNAYNAVAGLEIAIIHLYQKELSDLGKNSEWSDVSGLLQPSPSIFIPTGDYYTRHTPAGTF